MEAGPGMTEPKEVTVPFRSLRMVMLAALAWLYEHDTGRHATNMDSEIDPDELATIIDRLSGVDDGESEDRSEGAGQQTVEGSDIS